MPWRGASARRLAALHDVPMSALRYRFDAYELDAPARELRTARGPVALPPKSFDCLVYLLERRERAVGRDELISAVWGRIDVSDALLGQTLARARRAVGDTGEEQRVIRTVARFGYHWVAPVEIIGDDALPGAVAAGPVTGRDAEDPRGPPGTVLRTRGHGGLRFPDFAQGVVTWTGELTL